MRPNFIVHSVPIVEDTTRLPSCRTIPVQEFVPQSAIKGLYVAISLELARESLLLHNIHPMNITVNGALRDITPDTTVAALIAQLNLKPELTAVQLNDTILPRGEAAQTMLSEGDTVELIRIVGGG